MKKTKEEIMEIVGDDFWSSLCETAKKFIKHQPEDATIECIYISGPELWYEDENTYDWKCIGYEQGFYAYIIAWKPGKPHEIKQLYAPHGETRAGLYFQEEK